MCGIQQKPIVESNKQNSEETEGFDIQAGLSWIYPTNYPLRDYQFNIIQQSLYKNTLVSLPTGLGKTFIAAVVMYNFYRWYPTGKVIFMAPTKPLVKQQVDACYNIMAIPQNVTAELTGMKQNSTRNDIWMEKRVFFVTPQVLQNDLDSFPDLGASIKCIVFDEAHKARGNYAYCEVIKKLKCRTKYFRVIALSATPGNGVDDIGEVIRNLIISHLEFRNEESPDVKPYVFDRKLETIVVPLGDKLEQVKMEFSQILEKYARTLMKYQVIQGNYSTLTKGRIFMAKTEIQARSVKPTNYSEIMRSLNICMSLYHAYELLIRHGLRGFLSFLDQHTDHVLLRGITHLIDIREDVRNYLGPLPNVDQMADGTYPEVPLNIKFGHPKHYKLRDVLISHFSVSNENSKVIVFFEYRDSVMEAFVVLLQARPLIRAKVFLGQKSGITQRMQLNVIKSFRDGNCNTLLSTCIGEEGLDVGEVDLIVCFDVSTKSPIRMVQRMGRTGRKREGQVIILVTEGKEQQTLNDCLLNKNNLKNWVGSSKLMEKFFVWSPRMVPDEINPQCMKMQITVQKPMITKKSTLKDMLRTISSSSSSSLIYSEDAEIIEIEEKIPEPIFLFDKSLANIIDFNLEVMYNKYLENQRILQGDGPIKPSDASNLFVGLMKFADSKRFNIPLTQDVDKELQNKNLKQGDIRSMFLKASSRKDITPSQEDFNTQKTQSSTSIKSQSDMVTQSSKEDLKLDEFYKVLHMEIANYLSIELTMDSSCEFCNKLYQCSIHSIVTMHDDKFTQDLKHWIPPEFSKVERITLEDLESYEKTISTESVVEENNVEDSLLELLDGNDISSILSNSKIEKGKLKDKSFNFEAPKSFSNLLDTFNISSTYPIKEQPNVVKIYENPIVSETDKVDQLLSFFKLDSIEDIYESSNKILDNSSVFDETIICANADSGSLEDIFENCQLSPVLDTHNSPTTQVIDDVEPSSPVLGTCKKIQSLKDRAKDRRSLDIIDTSVEERTNFSGKTFFGSQIAKPKLQRNISNSSEKGVSKNYEELNVSKEDSEDDNLLGYFGTRKKLKTSKKSKKDADSLNFGDLCDLSAFGLTSQAELNQQKIEPVKNSTGVLSESYGYSNTPAISKTDDVSDISVLLRAEPRIEENSKKHREKKHSSVKNSATIQLDKPLNDETITSDMRIDEFCDLSVFGLAQNHGAVDPKDNFKDKQHSPIQESVPSNFKDQQHSPINKSDPSNSRDLETTEIEFADFLEDLRNEYMSTQRKLDQKVTHTILRTSHEKSTAQKNKKKNECFYSVRSENDHMVETVIIEDSPIKDSVFDLTLSSPFKKVQPKRKILSQLSITQVISLASKQTQSKPSQLHTQSNPKLDKIDLNASKLDISENVSGECNKANTDKCPNNKKESTPKKLRFIDKSQSTSQSSKEKISPNKFNLMDDLHNFEEFNESFSIKQPSVFKKTEIKKCIPKQPRNQHNRSSVKMKSVRFSSTLGSKMLSVESDDEFEDPGNTSFFNSTKISRTALKNDSDDEFETAICPSKMVKRNDRSKRKSVERSDVKMRKKQCYFIEQEAEVSSDTVFISDDESSEDGSFDESFVDDDTQKNINDTQMQVKYLRSVKSPQNLRKFKLPATLRPVTSDIYSQVVDPEEANSYVNDSFCVNTQDIGAESSDLSHLEILEQKLQERQKMKRKASRSDNNKITKRKKIVILDSDSE